MKKHQNACDRKREVSESEKLAAKLAEKQRRMIAKLRTKPEISSSNRALFGVEITKELVELFTTGPVLEADLLVCTGSLTQEDLVQYIHLLPEYDQVERDIIQLVSKIIDHLKPSIPSIINASRRREDKGTVLYVYKQIQNLMKNIRIDEPCYRNHLIMSFWLLLLTQFFSTLDDETIFIEKPIIEEALSKINQTWQQSLDGANFVGIDFLQEKNMFNKYINRKPYCEVFEDLAPKKELTPVERDSLKAELNADFEEIKELKEYRKILNTVYRIGRVKLAFYGDELVKAGQSHTGLCSFLIVLDENLETIMPEVKKIKQFLFAEIYNRDGDLHLHFNRATGELTFPSSIGFPISSIMDPDQYLMLKKTLYSLIKDYLWNKEPDIDDAFLPDPNRPIIETHQAVEEVMEAETETPADEEIEEGLIETQEQIDQAGEAGFEYQYQRYVKDQASPISKTPVSPIVQPSEDPETDHLRKKRKVEFIRRIRNLKPSVLLNMLTRLMGQPLKIQGSHYFFRSPKNSLVLPIPYHALHQVKFPLLKNCLEKWDLVEEFSLEVGIN
jgi:hypothetical protein